MNELIDLAPKSVGYMADDNIVMIDVRRPEEWKATGIIKDSHKMTFFDMYGNSDVPTWLNDFQKIVTSKEQQFILICAHANRTKVVGNMLNKQALYKNVYELEGGINYGWLDKGLKTIK